MEQVMGGNAQVDLKDGSMNIKGKDGTSILVGDNVVLPEDFPKDVYVIDGKILSAMNSVVGSGYQVTLRTGKNVDEIKSEYESKMKDGGWSIQQSLNMGGVVMISGVKEKRTLTVTVSADTTNITENLVILTVTEALNQ